jgi:TetR/AcrR family transcriptional regulator, transcriptional repressor for nem operon
MRKSKVETAETRKRIVKRASRILLEQGLSATGISEIMTEAGLTQGGFYRHFESKKELIAEASEAAYAQIFAVSEKAVAGKSTREAIDTMVRLYLYQHQMMDTVCLCPMANLASELPHADYQVKSVVNVGYQRMVANLGVLMQRLGIADYMALADATVSTMVGAVSISRIALTGASERAVLENAYNTINLLLASAPRSSAPA